MRTMALAVLALLVISAWALELRGPSPETLMVENRAHHLALAAFDRWGFPVEHRPTIVWNSDREWPHAGYMDCSEWTIELSRPMAEGNVLFVLESVLPHEYGHAVHCYLHHGRVGLEPHGELWKQYTAALGGDPNYRSEQ